MTKAGMTEAERFVKHIMPEPNTGCWLWAAAVRYDGYGAFMRSNGQGIVRAHRYAFESWVGAIPPAMVLDHICRERSCVNPAHLRAVPPRINAIENSSSPAAANAAKARCPTCGGSYHRVKNGRRYCRVCRNVWRRQHWVPRAKTKVA